MSGIAVAIAAIPVVAGFPSIARIRCQAELTRLISKNARNLLRSLPRTCCNRIACDSILVARPLTSTCAACSVVKSRVEIVVLDLALQQ